MSTQDLSLCLHKACGVAVVDHPPGAPTDTADGSRRTAEEERPPREEV